MNEKKKYIVVAWYNTIPYFLQMKGVVNWYFYNNAPKCFTNKETAIKSAKKIKAKYACQCVKVYDASGYFTFGGDLIKSWERKQQERIVFVAE